MRVCIVTPYDLSHDGGVNRHAQGLAGALRGLGHEVRVVGPASGPVPEGCDAVGGAIPIPANGSVARIGLLAPRARVREILHGARFDVVHLHEPIVPGPARHALHLARAPLVATFHASAEREPALQRALRAAAAGALARVRFGIAVSRAAKGFSRAIYRGRIAVVPNGVDLGRFGAAAARGEEGPGPLRLLFVGRFGERRKGLAVLLAAVARLRAAGRPVVLEVVGAGPVHRDAARAPPGVRFLGRIPDADLAARYQAADVLCAPSLGGESFGMVIVEAMAAGCPVVASALPGYAEAALGAALLVPPGDPAALAAALARAGDDPALRRRLAERGRARAGALCWTRVAGQVVRVYERAAA